MSEKKSAAFTINMTEGDPTSLLIRFAIPMLIGNLFQQFYNIVDSIIVGKFVGADALASVGATGSITFLFFALCNGVGSGGGIITSQAFGVGDEKRIKKCISNTSYLMFGMSLVIGTLAFFLATPMLTLLKTPENLMMDAKGYLKLQCFGLVFVALYNYGSSMLRALGDSKTPLYFLIFSCILNAGLDILFVYTFDMGVIGAGIATVISQFISGAASLVFAWKTNEYFRLTKEDMQPDSDIIESAVKLGVPLSMQFALIAVSCMALQRVVNDFGETAVSAFTAGSRIEQVIHQPYQTLGASLATFCGQNYGARKNDRLLQGFRKSMKLMIIFTLIMLPIMQIFPRQIVMIFVDDPDVIEMGATSLRITSPWYFALGVIYVVRGVLNGIGDAAFAFQNGLVEVACRLTIPIGLTLIPFIGIWGIWWSAGITWFISGLTAYLRYLSFHKKGLFAQTAE